jgi:NhaA family Na+:H+ antiporter
MEKGQRPDFRQRGGVPPMSPHRKQKWFVPHGLENVAGFIVWPFQRFFKTSATGGITLMAATVCALLLANSYLGHAYEHLWHLDLSFSFAGMEFSQTLHHWINDGLMSVFFFLVGLEIKREVLHGELSSWTNAALPIVAAIGGMIVPAVLYAAVNIGGGNVSGWGVPMATDIAFALGVVALLGRRIPASLIIFVTAFAIVDDLGAILVIALFYTESIQFTALIGAGGILVLSVLFNLIGVRSTLPYVAIGICLWFLLLKSGIHATVAGVLLAMTIPAHRKISHGQFVHRIQEQLAYMVGGSEEVRLCPIELDKDRHQSVMTALEEACHGATAPLQHIEHHLQPWVIFLIMPIFAFSNAGVVFDIRTLASTLAEPVPLGIMLGLFIGKQAGIFLFALLAVRLGFARLPAGVNWGQIYGVSILGGIGFTMSIFIALLAYGGGPVVESAKVGILAASILSGVVGYFVLRHFSPMPDAVAGGWGEGGGR